MIVYKYDKIFTFQNQFVIEFFFNPMCAFNCTIALYKLLLGMYGSNWVLDLKLNPTHGVGWDHMCVLEREMVLMQEP